MKTTRSPRATLLVALLAAGCLGSGCTTLQPVVLTHSAAHPELRVGDDVRVRTTRGETLTFEVSALDDDGLAGRDVRVRYAEIEQLQVRRISKGRTTAAVVATAALVVLAGGAINASHFTLAP